MADLETRIGIMKNEMEERSMNEELLTKEAQEKISSLESELVAVHKIAEEAAKDKDSLIKENDVSWAFEYPWCLLYSWISI